MFDAVLFLGGAVLFLLAVVFFVVLWQQRVEVEEREVTIQQMEANIIAPRVVSHRVGLHPIVIIFALFVARELFGVVGMLVAVPVTATIRVFARHIYKHFL